MTLRPASPHAQPCMLATPGRPRPPPHSLVPQRPALLQQPLGLTHWPEPTKPLPQGRCRGGHERQAAPGAGS